LIEPSRERQAKVLAHLTENSRLFIPRSKDEYADLRALIKSNKSIKGPSP